MTNDRAQHLARAKELLDSVWIAAMATVNADGTPHNTPFMILHEPDLSRIYWGSHPHSLHSQNITRTGQAFFVLYEATKRGGLYIKADHCHALEGAELEAALKVHNDVRASRGQDPLPLDYYRGASPQRMWSATPTNFWINSAKRDADGRVIEDLREEVSAEELLK